jgi:hypothetical protein
MSTIDTAKIRIITAALRVIARVLGIHMDDFDAEVARVSAMSEAEREQENDRRLRELLDRRHSAREDA